MCVCVSLNLNCIDEDYDDSFHFCILIYNLQMNTVSLFSLKFNNDCFL